MVDNNPVRTLALVAMLSAVSVVGRVALAAIPSVQPTTVIIIVTTMVLGLRNGIMVAILSTLLSNFQLGHGIWTFFQMGAWIVVALLSYAYGKSRLHKNITTTAIFAGLTGLIYGAIVSLNGLLFTNKIILYYLASLPYDLAHAAGNIAFYIILGQPLYRLLTRLYYDYNKN